MLVKRYISKNMQQAMDTVIKELGADAVILNSRKVRQKGFLGFFKKKLVEVMVAYDPAKVPAVKRLSGGWNSRASEQEEKAEKTAEKAAETTGEAAKTAGEAVKAAGDGGGAQLRLLDQRIESLDGMLRDFTEKFSFVKREVTYDYPEEVGELFCSMVGNQVRDELAHLLARKTDMILKKQAEANPAEVMQHLVVEQLGSPEPIVHKKFTRQTVLVMGSTGAGKTTTIVKLAANFAVRHGKKVGIINTDTYRIGAQEQLQTYADILSIPLQVVYKTEELGIALESMADRDLIFIDTAGKSPGDGRHKEDIQNILRIAQPEDTLLCLPASTSFSAAKELLDTYGFVDRYKLLITKLDETRYRGMILNLSWYTQKSLAYVTTGQNVPDDIETVDAVSVANQILGLRQAAKGMDAAI